MLEAAVGRAALGLETDAHRPFSVTDHRVHLCGFGIAVAKFQAQRMFWGWVDLGEFPTPAYVHIRVVEREHDAIYEHRDVKAARRKRGEDPDLEGRTAAERLVVGLANFEGFGGNLQAKGVEKHRGMLPIFDFGLTPTGAEWALVHECLAIGQGRDGQRTTFNVRLEFLEPIDQETFFDEPWRTTIPITRFWIEGVVRIGAGLDNHPVYQHDIRSGGIERIF